MIPTSVLKLYVDYLVDDLLNLTWQPLTVLLLPHITNKAKTTIALSCLCARYCSKHFTYISLFNSHNNFDIGIITLYILKMRLKGLKK